MLVKCNLPTYFIDTKEHMFYNKYGDDMNSYIMHLDVNNAFLSWTAVDMLKKGAEVDIRTIPSVIGGDEKQRHGVVLAKSPIAKQFGIKTGETIYQARKKCPELRIFPCKHPMYKQYSDNLYSYLLEYTDKIERFSVDECFIDCTSFIRSKTEFLKFAKEISNSIKEKFEFTVNIGLSTCKILAKMASDFEKPDKIHTLYPNEIPAKMWPLPIGDLFMVGKKSVPKLNLLGIYTIGDLANYNTNIIIQKFGKFGKMIWEYANGIDKSSVHSEAEPPKGVGNSITLSEDYNNLEELNKVLLALTEKVSYRLRKHKLKASVVNVQIKTNEFITYSHQKKISTYIDTTKEIYAIAKELLLHLYQGQSIRLLGVRVDGLIDKTEEQLSLFSEHHEREESLENAMDKIKEKYGYDSITLAGKLNLHY